MWTCCYIMFTAACRYSASLWLWASLSPCNRTFCDFWWTSQHWPSISRWGSDSSRGLKSEQGGGWAPRTPLTLTTAGMQYYLAQYLTWLGCPFGRTGGLLFCSWCFPFFQRVISELPRSITAKLRHMIGTCVNFVNWLQKFRGRSPQKNLGTKNMQNFGRFYITFDFDREYLRNGSRYPKPADVTNYGNSSCVWWKKSAELWSTNGLELHASLDPLNCTFWETIFQPIGGAALSYFYTR